MPVISVELLAAVVLPAAASAAVTAPSSAAAAESRSVAAERQSPSPWPLLYDSQASASASPLSAPRRPQVPDPMVVSFPLSPVDPARSTTELLRVAGPRICVLAAPSSSSVLSRLHRLTVMQQLPAYADSCLQMLICSCKTITDHQSITSLNCPKWHNFHDFIQVPAYAIQASHFTNSGRYQMTTNDN